jgi:hypothetical protein
LQREDSDPGLSTAVLAGAPRRAHPPGRGLVPFAAVLAAAVVVVVGFLVVGGERGGNPETEAAAFWSDLDLNSQIDACALVVTSGSGYAAAALTPVDANFSVRDLALVLDEQCYEYLQTQGELTEDTSTSVTQPEEGPSTTAQPEPQYISGVAPPEYWVEGVEMAQPPCDGSWIAIVNSAASITVIKALRSFSGSQYMRNDITCDSLNPIVPSGRRAGEPLYVVFYGPFFTARDAQQQCLDLGITSASACFVAPLTMSEADRSVRYGPLD